ncbi:DUF4261 domain-containing protein [Anaerobiospirillum succiniciproducens]|uniref:DUF4261 domain-containing protein n=1 Tax=Anaerobiospirillum succiniciproducens TaxID=13335 RepID=UPI003F8AEEEB
MDILQKCQKWNQEGHFDKVIKSLDGIVPNERTPEMDLQLALALTNQGVRVKNGSHMIERVIELLEPHEELLGKSFMWNFIMGNAYFLLNEEGRALKYLECASEAEPDDESSKANIALCIKRLTMPVYKRSYRARVLMAWLSFVDQEKEILRLLKNLGQDGYGDRVLQKLLAIFSPVLPNTRIAVTPIFFMYEIMFTPDGSDVALHALNYLKQHAPKRLKNGVYWRFVIGRPTKRDISLKLDGDEFKGSDVKLWLTKNNGLFYVCAYCPKLLPTKGISYQYASMVLEYLMDIAIGEIANMRYIFNFDILEKPKSGKFIYLSDLKEKLISEGCDLDIDAEHYLETNYTEYGGQPDKNPHIWREDIYSGSLSALELLECYASGNDRIMDKLHENGICAGFIAYSLSSFKGSDRAEKIIAFREKFEDYLTKDGLGDVAKVVGSAIGIGYGYVDVMVWDLRPFLDAAYDFFNESDIEHVVFHSFRRHVGTVTLKQAHDDGQTHDFGINYVRSPQVQNAADKHAKSKQHEHNTKLIAYDPTQAQAFYAQIEKLNTQNEYLKCITALESVDRKYWDYNHAYILARALQNYAIKGDRLEQTPIYKADEALLRSIELLKYFKTKGKIDYRKFKYLALGYKYLYDQEERAITYAKKWASHAPDDESALKLIDECKEAIDKRTIPLIELINDAKATELIDDSADMEDDVEFSSEHTANLPSFILLDKLGFDHEALIDNLKSQWGIVNERGEGKQNIPLTANGNLNTKVVIMRQGNKEVIISYIPLKIPQDLKMAARNNYKWPQALAAAKKHKALIVVSVAGDKSELMDLAMILAKVTAACCSLKSASAVYMNDVLVQKDFYINAASAIKENKLPLDCWIWFGIRKTKKGYSAYTSGLEAFGKDELEVLDADCEPEQLRKFLYDCADCILSQDMTLADGSSISINGGKVHNIERSKGVALPGRQTLKIEYKEN